MAQTQSIENFTPIPASSTSSSSFQTPAVTSPTPSSQPITATVTPPVTAMPTVTNNMTASQITTPTPNVQGSLTGEIVPTPDTTPVATANAGYQSIVEQQQKDLAASEASTRNNSVMSDVYKSLGLDGSTSIEAQKAQEQATLNTQYGTATTTARLGELAKETQANDLMAKAQIERIGANTGGITNTDQAGFAEQINRQTASKNLLLAAESLTLQGKLDSANIAIKNAIDTKYAGQEAKLANQLKFLELNKDVLGREGEKQKALAEAKMKDLAVKKETEANISKMIIEASQVAPADILAKAKELQAKGGTAIQIANVLGKYGGDYWAREKIKSEIAKNDAEAAKNRTAGNGIGVAGAVSSSAKDWVAQYNSGAMSLEDIYTKIGSTKEAGVLKNAVAKLIAEQGGKRKYGTDDASVQAINAQIKNVNDLLYGQGKTEADKTTGDYGTIAGFVQGGLGIIPDRANVYKQDAVAIAKNLVSNQTLQALADAKSKGITFGALSEGELALVADSASRIATKLNKDGTGFSGSEKQFKDDLKTIKEGLEKSITNKTQTPQSKPESTADDIMTANKNIYKEQSGLNLFEN